MNASVLDRTVKAYRIGAANNQYPIFDGTGSTFFPGRWNTARGRVIYSSQHYSTALLEKLVHSNTGKIPRNQQWIEITIPAGTSFPMRSLLLIVCSTGMILMSVKNLVTSG